MQIHRAIILASLAFLCGCEGNFGSTRGGGKTPAEFKEGIGDVRQFILDQSIKMGGQALATNELPVIGGDWSYAEEEYGTVAQLPRESFSEVETFLLAAFGVPKQAATETIDGSKVGWYSAEDIGVGIQFSHGKELTQVTIVSPDSAAKVSEDARDSE